MNNALISEAYDILSESIKNYEPYIKVLHWAIQKRYNSPVQNYKGNPSHIGNFFDTIFFKNYYVNQHHELVLCYTATLKRDIEHGSSTITDRRKVIIEYMAGDTSMTKESVDADIRRETTLADAVKANMPPPFGGDDVFQQVAQEYVQYAFVYFEKDTKNGVLFKNLDTFATKLADAHFLGGIKRTGVKDQRGQGGYVRGLAYWFTVPSDKVADYNRFEAKVWDRGGFDIPTDDGKGVRHIGIPGSTKSKHARDEQNNLLFAVQSTAGFDREYANKCLELGFTNKINTIDTKNTTGTKDVDLGSLMNKEWFGGGAKTGKKRSTATGGGNRTGSTTTVTLAFEADSFESGRKGCNIGVKLYKMDHPKSNADIEIDEDGQAVTISGLSPQAIEKIIDMLKDRGLEFSKI